MPASSFVKNQNDGRVTLLGLAGTPSLQLAVDAGDFAASGMKRKLKDTTAYQRRGIVTTVRHTTRTFPTVTFSGQVMTFAGHEGGGSNGNIFEATLGYGATWGSASGTFGANADVYTVDVKFEMEGGDFGDLTDHELTYHDVELSIDFAEGDPNMWTCNGTVYGEIDGDLETLLPT